VITIDASILVAAAEPDDPAALDASEFLKAALRSGADIHEPTLCLVEVATAIARRTRDVDLASEAGSAILALPGLVLHPLDLEASADAAAIAARLGLRGADAIYAATALRHAATLVTLDVELLERSSSVIDAVTPEAWLERVG
jgi:predicted nucleic acid-binding protein